ncbi:MAG: hypothetical protein OXP07_21535 [Defluviicoccus sp.]|nr:hypothetical protein [Defluviicoccus sp.]
MAVVGPSEPRRDRHPAVAAAVAADDAGAELPGLGLPRHRLEGEAERVAETVQVLRHRVPGQELARLAIP